MHVLAQSDFMSMPGASVAIWMAIAAASLFLWNQANEALDRRKEQPPPAQTYAKATDCVARHAEVKAEVAVVHARIDKMEQASLESRRAMHRDIDSIATSAAALDATTNMINQRLVQIDGKLDRWIERQTDSNGGA